jgi:acyl-CoA:acyl-CoA alkyltransferase
MLAAFRGGDVAMGVALRELVRSAGDRQLEGVARLRGAAVYLPAAVLSSQDLEARVRAESPGVNVPWNAVTRISGVRSRHVAADDEQTSDLAAGAARVSLARAEVDRRDVDALIFAAASQDLTEPATANIVQEKLGTNCPVFDIKNACNSFLCGLQVAESLIASGQYRNVVVASGEIPSRGIKWSVRDFDDFRLSFAGYTLGDAGAAVLVSGTDDRRGIFYRKFQTHSRYWNIGTVPGGGSMHPRGDEWTYFVGDGTKIGAAVASIGPGIFQDALRATGTTVEDYARILVHQVTMPFLKAFCATTGVPMNKLVVTLPVLGNMASASMPVQLALAEARGDVRPGDLVAWVGMASGISLGVMLMEL